MKYSIEIHHIKLIFANKSTRIASDFAKFLETHDLDLTKNLHPKKINFSANFTLLKRMLY